VAIADPKPDVPEIDHVTIAEIQHVLRPAVAVR
jgi:hypothetical protein